MRDQTESTDHAAGTEGGQRVGIVNLTSTEAKAENENKTGNLRRKVSSQGVIRRGALQMSWCVHPSIVCL